MSTNDFSASLFPTRHIGPRPADVQAMLKELKLSSVDQLIDETVPRGIRLKGRIQLDPAKDEPAALAELKDIAGENQIFKSHLGMGYYPCHVPGVIQRNILENPGWYTQYTPYQSEISQGRLEALLNFQTLVSDLTGLPVSNASLLDEATAAAEAMT
ncbi:MAG: glycine dehydrogenase (aminomethyl-transferring), partial [Bacteriovoracia bacterium]